MIMRRIRVTVGKRTKKTYQRRTADSGGGKVEK